VDGLFCIDVVYTHSLSYRVLIVITYICVSWTLYFDDFCTLTLIWFIVDCSSMVGSKRVSFSLCDLFG